LPRFTLSPLFFSGTTGISAVFVNKKKEGGYGARFFANILMHLPRASGIKTAVPEEFIQSNIA